MIPTVLPGTSFYAEHELKGLGLKKYGKDVRISRKCSIYRPELISMGDHVRVDDFAILSGKITIGSYVHIAAYAALYASEGITVGDFVGISVHTATFTVSEDFSGACLTNPTVPDAYRAPQKGAVRFGRHSMLGAGSVVLPGADIGEGTAVGALALVMGPLPAWKMASGIPARVFKERRQAPIKKLEARLRANEK